MAKLPRTSFPEAEDKPLRKAVRRLRWFIQAYSGQISELSADTGIEFEIDRSKLRAVFLKWVKAFEGQNRPMPRQRPIISPLPRAPCFANWLTASR